MVANLGILLLSTLLVVSATTCCLAQQTYYVKPDPSTPCDTNLPCHSLDHYVAYGGFYFHSNTTLAFLPGRFHLSQEVFISDLEGFALLGSTQYKNTSGMLTGVPDPSTEIYCTGPDAGAFGFYNITKLYISNLVFTHCGYVGLSQISLTPTPALYVFYVRDLSVVGVVVQNSTRYGMLLYKTAGNVTIYGSTFMFNSGTEQNQWSNLAIVEYLDVGSCIEKSSDRNLVIQSSQIVFGSNGPGLFLDYSPCNNNMVAITDVIFRGNGASSVFGGNMYNVIKTNMGVNTLNTIHIDGCYFADGEAASGGGLVLFFTEEQGTRESTLTNTSHSVFVSNSQFVSNQALMGGGGVAVVLDQSRHHASIHMKNVTFESNICLSPGYKGGAINLLSITSGSHSLVIENSHISDGAADYGGGIALLYLGSQKVQTTAVISHTTIVDNHASKEGGGLFILFAELSPDIPLNHTLSCCDGNIHINNVTFERNTCLSPEYEFGFGGAVAMVSNSSTIGTFLLIENSYVSSGNARYGGGIAIEYSGSQDIQAMVGISHTTIVDNLANKLGGGIYIENKVSPDIPRINRTLSDHDLIFYMKNITIERNTCLSPEDDLESGFGGAIAMFSNTSVSTFLLIEDSYMAEGVARDGGGIAAVYSSNARAIAVISNTIIEHNVASQFGGGMLCRIRSNVHIYIRNVTVISNSAGNVGGGIHIISYWPHILTKRTFSVNISEALIVDNTAVMGGGLALHICNTREIDIVRTIFSRNHAVYYGGNIVVTDCVAAGTITINDSNIQYGTAEEGAGIAYYIVKSFSSIPILSTCHLQQEEMLHISRTHFLDNVSTGSADIRISIDMYQNIQGSLKIIRFEQCTLNHSSSCTNDLLCPIVSIDGNVDPQPETYNKFEFLLKDTVFQSESGSAIVQLKSLRKITISNCSFTDNNATAIMASSSNIFLEGSLLFRNNVGYNGGALALFDNSMLFLYPNTHVQFVGNSALHAGGAIYVDQVPIFLTISNPCFYQIKLSNTSLRFIDEEQLEMYNISIDLVNNTAIAAGSALYGGSVDSCRVYFSNFGLEMDIISYNYSTYFNKLFSITTPSSDYSPISSDPIGVCFCQDNKPDCENETLTNSTHPGALVAISAVVVGQRNGVVRDAIAIATYNGSDFTGKNFSSSSLCQNIELRVFSPPGLVNITFRPGGKENFQFFTRQLQVTVLPCPLGFSELLVGIEKQYACDCNAFLKDYGISCSIDNQTFQRPPNVWIGTSCTNLSTTEVCRVIVHDHCPFQYCKLQQTELTLKDTDSQCNLNHSGILCGGCRSGYSLVLGTSRCLQCSNKLLTLILVFVAAGLALVLLLMMCNMTVSDGTINGLIFYANIVGINSATFFPTGQGNIFTSLLSVFISWINLDLGIETCFYDRMDMYQKTWLQFAFPLYIWAIVLFLITATHYSTLAAKVLVRRNALKVLATLFLLSFAKLLQTTIAALSFVILKYSDGDNKAVWLYDGNIGYLTGKHVPLFVAALLVFVLLMLPYTVVLTFSQCIQRKSNHELLSWYTKLRLQPLFDAYTGPYKDRFRFWSGLLVIVRIVLFLVVALNALGDPSINLLAVSIVSVLQLWSTAGLSVYKRWPLTVLESFVLANLCFLSASTLYVQSSEGSQAAVTETIVGLVFVLFIVILSYHAYQEVQKTKPGIWVRNTCMQITLTPAGRRHDRVGEQSQQDETGEADGQPVPRRAPVQHWEIALEDPVSGEATLLPISPGTHPQSNQNRSLPDSCGSACAKEYSAEMYQRRYCLPNSSTHPLFPSNHNATSDPLQSGMAHLDTDPAPTDQHFTDTTTRDHIRTDSHSSTTLYRDQVSAFISSTPDDNPEYRNHNELQTIKCHRSKDDSHPSLANTTEVPSYSSSSDYRDQIFEILAFDSSSRNHSQFEPENSSPVQVINHDEDDVEVIDHDEDDVQVIDHDEDDVQVIDHDEDDGSDSSIYEYESLLQN